MADGVYGGIVIHSRDDPLKKGPDGDFDDERVLYVADHMFDQAQLIAERLHNWEEGYKGHNIPPMPDSVLINGVGQADCSDAQPGTTCSITTPSEIRSKLGSRTRFRVINPGAHGR